MLQARERSLKTKQKGDAFPTFSYVYTLALTVGEMLVTEGEVLYSGSNNGNPDTVGLCFSGQLANNQSDLLAPKGSTAQD